MKSWDQFQEIQLDLLREIGNIGAGNAATALSNLVNKTIDMRVPNVKVLSFDEITEFIGGAEEVVVSVFLRIEGDIPGNMFFFLGQAEAKRLVESMMGKSEVSADGFFSEMELSAIQEVGNILSGSYLSALADFTKLNLQPSVPALAIDMAAAILSYGLIEVGKAGDYALVIDTSFLDEASTEVEANAEDSNIKGQFVLLPDPDSFSILFEALGVPFYE
jgi:chemotaxis protein CheC